jgi:hypothetical protein
VDHRDDTDGEVARNATAIWKKPIELVAAVA